MNEKRKRSRSARIVRAVALLLAVISVAGVAYHTLIPALIDVYAKEIRLKDYEIDGDTKKNIYIACGIHFSDDPEVCCTPSSPNGFIIGESYVTLEERNFTPLIIASEAKDILVAQITHLKLSDGLYIPCKASEATVLPYHVEIKVNGRDVWELKDEIDKALELGKDMFCVKAISSGVKALRYGAFTDATSAGVYAGEVEAILANRFDGIEVNISIPTGTGLCFIDKANGQVLFEHDNGGDFTYAPALYPINNEDGTQVGTTLASGRTYFDAMAFVRDGDMINSTNIVQLDTYVQGVLPSEIYSSWPLEVQKAFAIIVRSLTISFIGGKHYKSYHVDMCATACCQAYKGRMYINDTVIEAVNSTSGLILAYEGELVSAFYMAVNGGESIASNYAWGGNAYPHLPMQKTPWEKYTTYSNNRGVWFQEFTPQELLNQLRSKGYTELKKPIKSVSVDARAGDSGYVYKMTYTDTAGNSVSLTRTSKNYGTLGLRSANFNIGKDSVDYFVDHVLSISVIRTTESNPNPLMSLFNIITGDGIFSADSTNSKVITSSGIKDLGHGANYALTEDGLVLLPQYDFELSEPDENGYYKAVNVYGDTVITTFLQRENLTYEASAKGNFVIAGKGWGHGIGLSQYGANDLAQVGAEYDQIINAYYTGVEILTLEEYFKN